MIDPWEAVHDRNGADYQAVLDRLRPAGFRPISACVYGPRQAPLYAAIFSTRPGPDFVATHGVNAAGLQAFFDTNAARGYSPTILSATGPSNDPVFLCVMELSTTGLALTRSDLVTGGGGPHSLEHWLAEADSNNWIPRCIGAYGSAGDVRFTLVADANVERLLWAVAGPEGRAEYQSRFIAETQQYARPVLVSVGPTGYMSIFREDDIGPWEAHHDLDSAGYQTVLNQRVGQGLAPVMVQAGTLDGTNRFAALARSNRPETRTMRVDGPVVPALAAVDDAITNYLRTTGTRAASVSVTRHVRLVYSRSFTWAEPAYPLTTGESLFRIASMSKPITAMAIFRLVEQGLINLDSALIPTLGLVAPAGWTFAPNVATITVRHLLAHSSGLGDVVDAYDDVVRAYGTTLPTNERQMAGFALSKGLGFAPGADKAYSNAGYLILGLIIEQVTGESYENAVRRLVMTPLGITRAHLTATRRSDQRPGAVRHHAGGMGQADLPLVPSAIEEWAIPLPWVGNVVRLGRPLAAREYGGGDYGFFDAFGGWCLASADFARILASFERAPNPLFSAASVTAMTTPVVITGNADRNFSLGWYVTTGAGETMIGFGGILGGMSTGGTRSSAGWSVTALQNSDAPLLTNIVEAAVRSVPLSSWPATDSWTSAQLPAW